MEQEPEDSLNIKMTCPQYQSDGSCGFHSQYYILAKQTVEEYCTSAQAFNSCEELINQLERASRDTEQHISEIEEGQSKGIPNVLKKSITI